MTQLGSSENNVYYKYWLYVKNSLHFWRWVTFGVLSFGVRYFSTYCLSVFGHSVFGHSAFGHSVYGHSASRLSTFGHSAFGHSASCLSAFCRWIKNKCRKGRQRSQIVVRPVCSFLPETPFPRLAVPLPPPPRTGESVYSGMQEGRL